MENKFSSSSSSLAPTKAAPMSLDTPSPSHRKSSASRIENIYKVDYFPKSYLHQIVDASQVSSALIATLHYQIVYIIQNHALDLSIPKTTSNEVLLITMDSSNANSCVHVSR